MNYFTSVLKTVFWDKPDRHWWSLELLGLGKAVPRLEEPREVWKNTSIKYMYVSVILGTRVFGLLAA